MVFAHKNGHLSELRGKLRRTLIALSVCMVFSITVKAQYFTLPGWHDYALNRNHQVFDLSPDGKIGISLRGGPLLTTFDPILGTQMDSKSFGFGALEVNLAQVGNSLRAVVLTSEGGPRKIYLFDVSSTGQLSQIASTQLTTSNTDDGSNVVLSGSGQVGFVSVATNGGGADLVCFSLIDGAVLNRLSNSVTRVLALSEAGNTRVVVFRNDNVLKVVNAANPNQLTVTGSVPLVANGEFSGSFEDGLAFSLDGRYVFLGSPFFNFAAIDLNAMQVVGTIPGSNYRFGRVRIFESGQQRTLAVLSSQSGTPAILLVDASDPSHLAIINQYNPPSSESFFSKSDFAFSHDGLRLYAAAKEKLIAFDLPSFNKAWQQPVPGAALQVHQLRVYGQSDEVLGAWDTNLSGFTSIFGAFPAFPPNVSISDSAAVNEAGGLSASFTITVSASAAPHRVVVSYVTADGTASWGSDYTQTIGTVILDPGVTTTTVSVPIVDDTIDEFDETFTLNLTNAGPGIIIQAQGTATILDDDPPPTVAITNVNITEGDTGTKNATFFVTLSTASAKPITVNYATAGGTATPDVDYNSASGLLSFAPGEGLKNVVVAVVGDTLSEGNETFFVNLTNPSNVTIADDQGLGTILDFDAPILALEQNSQRGIALDSVLSVRDPFVLNNPNYFGSDQRTRITLFITNLSLTPGLIITAAAQDSQQTTFQPVVEFVGSVPGLNSVTQVVLKLPDGIVSAGDLQISVTARGQTSNKVLVGVMP